VALLATADALRRRYETKWELAVLDQNVDVLRTARQLLESPSAAGEDRLAKGVLPLCLVQLALAYDSRYKHTADTRDIEEQIQCCEAVLAISEAKQHHERATRLLAAGLQSRFRLTGDAEDINRAVKLEREQLDGSPQPTASLLSQLGRGMMIRFERSGALTDLEEAVKLQEQSLAIHSTRDYDLADYQLSFAQTLRHRYLKFGALDNLEHCIRLASDSVMLREGHRDRHVSLDALAVFYVMLSQRSQDFANIDKAIEYFEEVLALLGKSHPRYPRALSNLAAALRNRHLRKESLPDLDRAIESLRESLTLIPAASHLDRHVLLINLSGALVDRLDIVGDVHDEDASIALGREALSMLPPGHVNRQNTLGNLASNLSRRYRRTENQEDVTEAMSLYDELLGSLGPGQLGQVYDLALINFAELLITRHRFTGSPEDLDRAIALHERWLEQGATKPVRASMCLHDAANALLCRFRLSHDESDLSNAIAKLEAALALHHARRYAALHDLSNALQLRFQTKGHVDDMEAAMRHQTAALEYVPAGHPGRSRVLYGFSRIHTSKNTPYHDVPLALEHAVHALLDASSSVQSRIEGFLELLPDITSTASQHEEAGPQLLDVFRHALQLLPQMAFLGLDVRERLRMLKQTEHLAILSADLALRLERPDDAVEVLEEGRAVFWTQYLRLRTKFDLLPSHLADELIRLARQIEQGTQRFKRHPSGDTHNKNRAAEDAAVVANRQLAVQFESLVKEARLLPGFERFLLHDSYAMLSWTAERCPVVVLLAANNRCAAILIRGQGTVAEHVPFPGITVEQLQKLTRTMNDANRNARSTRNGRAMRQMRPKGDGAARTLRELWEFIGEPLVNAIGLPVRDVISSNISSFSPESSRAEIQWTSTASSPTMYNRCFQSRSCPRCTNLRNPQRRMWLDGLRRSVLHPYIGCGSEGSS
jgi:tetratricopeptide (TPR) repeat protein